MWAYKLTNSIRFYPVPKEKVVFISHFIITGVFKPSYHTDGLIYSFNLVSFAVPEVIVDITAINVDEVYIAELIDEIGEKVKTNATTKSIRLMR